LVDVFGGRPHRPRLARRVRLFKEYSLSNPAKAGTIYTCDEG
jgi:hypothetical protein